MPDELVVSSSGFGEGAAIPVKFTCDGENVSPMLDWQESPTGTESFAIVLQDPDAPGGTFIHWLVANIPASTTQLPEGWEPDAGVVLGTTGFGETGYLGPCPPPPDDAHTYEFVVQALDSVLDLADAYSVADFTAAAADHVIVEGALTGEFDH